MMNDQRAMRRMFMVYSRANEQRKQNENESEYVSAGAAADARRTEDKVLEQKTRKYRVLGLWLGKFLTVTSYCPALQLAQYKQ